MLEIKKLTKIYDDKKVLDNVNFKIENNGITAFLGANGAGKTTTFKFLIGSLNADSGELIIDNKKVDTSLPEYKLQFGYLPEDNPLYEQMRVDELLIYFAKLKDTDINAISKIAKSCGLDKVYEKKISTLSKGFKQRIGIARALLGNPKYIFLDEPTSGLDPIQKAEILELIKKISKNAAVIFSSHILSEVNKIADNVVVISNGQIKLQISQKELETNFALSNNISLEVKTTNIITLVEKLAKATNFKIESQEKITQNIYKLKLNMSKDSREEIFDLIIDSNSKLLEMTTQKNDIEEIFINLNKK